jgi:hypothetical protein
VMDGRANLRSLAVLLWSERGPDVTRRSLDGQRVILAAESRRTRHAPESGRCPAAPE